MCALFRDRMPDDENPAAANSRRMQAAAELQRTRMWLLISGLPAGHNWSVR
ncbi:MAG TPA: hypothetical protein VFA17_01870 [Thermoplasmata archaeon]|jgi:hypothetical protein|nr:hypothetical protein [Thermoplasmata archaeon]